MYKNFDDALSFRFIVPFFLSTGSLLYLYVGSFSSYSLTHFDPNIRSHLDYAYLTSKRYGGLLEVDEIRDLGTGRIFPKRLSTRRFIDLRLIQHSYKGSSIIHLLNVDQLAEELYARCEPSLQEHTPSGAIMNELSRSSS